MSTSGRLRRGRSVRSRQAPRTRRAWACQGTGASLSLEPALSYEPDKGLLAGLYFNPLVTYSGVGSLSQGPALANLLGLGANAAGQLRLHDQVGLLGEVGATHYGGGALAPGGQSGTSWAVRAGVAVTFNFRSTEVRTDTGSVAAGVWYTWESGSITGPATPSSASGAFTTNGVILGIVVGYHRPPETSP